MKLLSPSETELVGNWIDTQDGVKGDPTTERIHWLTSSVLIPVGVDRQTGEKLFQDPSDGRYWLRTYRFGDRQGNGPPTLTAVSLTAGEIQTRFKPISEARAEAEKALRRKRTE